MCVSPVQAIVSDEVSNSYHPRRGGRGGGEGCPSSHTPAGRRDVAHLVLYLVIISLKIRKLMDPCTYPYTHGYIEVHTYIYTWKKEYWRWDCKLRNLVSVLNGNKTITYGVIFPTGQTHLPVNLFGLYNVHILINIPAEYLITHRGLFVSALVWFQRVPI